MNKSANNQGRLPLAMFQLPDHQNINKRLRDFLLKMSQTVPDRGSNNASGAKVRTPITSVGVNTWVFWPLPSSGRPEFPSGFPLVFWLDH